MIIVFNKSGQFCNRILLFAHCIASAVKYKQRVFHMFFKDLDGYVCKEDKTEGKVGYSKKSNLLLCRINEKIINKRTREKQCKVSQKKANSVKKRRGIHIIWNWYYRDYPALFEQRDAVLAFLKPKAVYFKKAEENISKNKGDAQILVGLHIRRGDYIAWQGGKYYYDDAAYLGFMKQFADNCAGKKVKFFVCSNEKINIRYFTDNGINVFEGTGDFIEDIVSLSFCDYVMGPPSTFSWWAAYIGMNKYYQIECVGEQIVPDKFSTVEDERFFV